MSYDDALSHRAMVFDDTRNQFYRAALRTALSNGGTVLDLGAGLGVLGFVALQEGADHVYMVEPSPVLEHARTVAQTMGCQDRVTFVQDRIERASLPGPVDCIVSVFTGNGLFSEDLLPSLFFARDRFLATGGTLVPGDARLLVAAASLPKFYELEINSWRDHGDGIDYSRLRQRAINTVYNLSRGNSQPTLLSAAHQAQTIDFSTESSARCSVAISLDVVTRGVCHGLLVWFDLTAGQARLSTGPDAPQTHWSQLFFPLESPLDLREGDHLSVSLDRPEFGDWTWSIEFESVRQRQTSFLGKDINVMRFRAASETFAPSRGRAADVLVFALGLMDGQLTIRDIASRVIDAYPGEFVDRDDAVRYVRQLAVQYDRNS